MGKERPSKNFIQKPIYKGGHKALNQFVAANLKYPEDALKHKIEGDVKIKYTLNSKGKVVKTKLQSGIGFGCNEEALRIVELLRFTIPRSKTPVRANFHKNITIHFKLPPIKSPSIQYNYTSKEDDKDSPQKSSSNSFQITLKW